MTRHQVGTISAAVSLAAMAMVGPASAQEARKPAPAAPAAKKVEDYAPPEEFVMVGKIKTHYIHKGDAGPAIVLIHGFGSNTYSWRKNIPELAKNHRVFALDLKGFGLSDKPKDGQYHLNAYARHVVEFLDAMKLDKAVLIGNSMGGAVALQVALEHPDRVSGLVLVDAAPLDMGRRGVGDAAPQGGPVATALRGVKVNPILFRALVTRDLVERGLKSSFRDPKTVTDEMIDAYYIPTQTEGAPEALAAMISPPPEAAMPKLPPLSDLKPKTLIVWGRHDRVLPLSLAGRFEKAIPGARKVIFETSGHLPHEEDADQFNPLIDEFVRGLP